MNRATLTALKGSIAKWKAIVAGTGVDDGHKNCPLCVMFIDSSSFSGECDGCPVKTRTNEPGCGGSPYFDWLPSFGGKQFPLKAETETQKKLAAAELKFLRSLLPRPKKPARPAKLRAGK